MVIGKIITYNILVLLLMLNTLLIYFGGGVGASSMSREYLMVIAPGMIMFLLMWLLGLFANFSNMLSRGLYKKNYLRINTIILLILVIASIIGRIIELTNGVYCLICWIQTLLYILLFILTIFMLRDLHYLIKSLFTNNH